MKIMTLLTLSLVCVSATGLAASKTDAPPVSSDNSKINQRDRSEKAVTADQQKNNETDLKITQRIRQDIVADESLSTYAHNVKIITMDGKVALKGPVRSEEEKSKIVSSAQRVAGKGNVRNELEVTPST